MKHFLNIKILVIFLVFVHTFALISAELPHVFGSDFVGRGFDASSMEHKALPIVKTTFKGGDKWVDPFDTSSVFRVPNEMVVQNDPVGSFKNKTTIYHNVEDYQKDIRHESHHSGFLGFGSRSKYTRHFVHNHYERDDVMSHFYQYASYYKLSLFPLPPPQLDDNVAKLINQLPSRYHSDNTTKEWHAYHNFISQMGTHYVDSADMGGALKMTTYFHKCFLSMFSEDWVRKQSGWSFFGIINNKKGFEKYKRHLNEHWQEYHQSHVELLGGYSNLFSVTDYQQWLDTVKYNLTPLFYSITPIPQLVQDPVKRKNLKAAIDDYMNDGEQELINLMNSIPKDHHKNPSWCKPINQ